MGFPWTAELFSQIALWYEMKVMETSTAKNTMVILYNERGIKIYLFYFLHRYAQL